MIIVAGVSSAPERVLAVVDASLALARLYDAELRALAVTAAPVDDPLAQAGAAAMPHFLEAALVWARLAETPEKERPAVLFNLTDVLTAALQAAGIPEPVVAAEGGTMNPSALTATLLLIRSVAAMLHLDPLLVQAIVEVESDFDPNLVDPNADGSADYGLMQVNDHTLASMSGGWSVVPPRELLKPGVGLEAGCLCLREYLVCALHDELFLTVDHRAAGAVVAALLPEALRRVIERAVAYYNGGQGVKREPGGRWANQGYVDAVLAEWDRLKAGGE